ncbi:unnamed protein product [Coregonus sp. 'balchen']|nr:unnamed protein product [Coregonus sp. 'balchen']
MPWKSLTSIIEYYYMWKTTDRYVQQKRLKAAEAESKLKQLSANSVNSVKPGVVGGLVNGSGATAGATVGAGGVPGAPGVVPVPPGQTPGLGRACESCYRLKMPTRLEGERPGPNRNNMSPHGVPMRHSGSPKFAVKTKQAFYLMTTRVTRAARRVCQDIIRPRFLARHPYLPLNTAQIKQEYEPKMPLPLKPVDRKPLESVVRYLEAHPCPPKPDPPRGQTVTMGSLTPIKSTPNILNNGSPTILGKRTYEQHNGMDGTKPKAPQWDIMAKRTAEPGRTTSAPMQQDEVHELD